MKIAVILGAGFSKNSGVPVQSEIPELLITYKKSDDFETAVSMLLKKFMEDIFSYTGNENFPYLDDIFTCIDISTNSGHHLGIRYPSVVLRGIRRFLVYRVFSLLEDTFMPNDDVRNLMHNLDKRNFETEYITLNWDNVLERYLLAENFGNEIDYCNGGINWDGMDSFSISRKIKVMKPHGSCNWLYCDNCRAIYYDIRNKINLQEKAGFLETDLHLLNGYLNIDNYMHLLKSKSCRLCGNSISSHIATFSYRKTFRANSFSNIWKEAEQTLSDSDRWVFIGYSLPNSDYEFKHLLKISELKLEHAKKEQLKVDVVLLNSDKTISTYESFFGKKLNHVCNSGIKGYIDYLKTI